MKSFWLTPQITLVFALFGVQMAHAEEVDKGLETVKAAINSLHLRDKPEKITKSVIPGMYQVIVGQYVLYVSADGRYMLQGDLYDVHNRINLTDEIRQEGRVKAMSKLDEDSLIVFSPKADKVKYTITAFTDVDCGYCRKLHKEIKQYNDLGIAVRYASYPRAGVNSPSFYKAAAVWCAADQHKAMTMAKNGASLQQLRALDQEKGKTCDDSIKQQMSIANKVGVTGTPTLVMQDGAVLPGYLPPKRLLQALDEDAKRNKTNNGS
jgi:thiol:disulfide interchange protein DsbC